MFIFLIGWAFTVLLGVFFPKWFIQKFDSMALLLGINPKEANSGALILCRISNGLMFCFCVFIIGNMMLGNVKF
jgi:hypothetical protein